MEENRKMKLSGEKVNESAVAMIVAAAILVLVSALLAGGSPTAGSGESTYKAKCAVCHAANGSGDTSMGKKMKLRDLRSPEVQKQTDSELSDVIAKGKGKMPAYAKQLD